MKQAVIRAKNLCGYMTDKENKKSKFKQALYIYEKVLVWSFSLRGIDVIKWIKQLLQKFTKVEPIATCQLLAIKTLRLRILFNVFYSDVSF